MTPLLPALARETLLVGIYNTAIALFLTAITEHDLATNLIYSHAIGLSMYGFVRTSCLLRGARKPEWQDGLVGIPFGAALGFTIGTWSNGLSLTELLVMYPNSLLVSAATALFFGIIAIAYFGSRARLEAAEAETRAARLARSEQEAAATHAELARLQAQIEPHFLFNTLSNVVGLIDTDPAAARRMLLDLTALLRTSLARSRRSDVALAEELELLRAYLGIMAIRMGERLSWQIDAAADVLAARLPPLLVQPLVENAIRHGLEPKPEGGRLTIRCRRAGDTMRIEVEDSGRGIDTAGGGAGVGLANVRERLAACYGDKAAFVLEANAAGGVTARLELPCAC
ncbi:MAG: histidine kinase [Rhodocyclales bacterium]|nr:histidine kinase [Rhodocyclales bacterium]